MAKRTAKRPAPPAKQKARKPVKCHSAKEKTKSHSAPVEKQTKADRLAAHRHASGKAAAALAAEGGSPSGNGHAHAPSTSLPTKEGFDIQEKVKELVRLSKEQGYLTY